MEAVFAKTKEKMDKCLTSLERDFAAIRAGRPLPYLTRLWLTITEFLLLLTKWRL